MLGSPYGQYVKQSPYDVWHACAARSLDSGSRDAVRCATIRTDSIMVGMAMQQDFGIGGGTIHSVSVRTGGGSRRVRYNVPVPVVLSPVSPVWGSPHETEKSYAKAAVPAGTLQPVTRQTGVHCLTDCGAVAPHAMTEGLR